MPSRLSTLSRTGTGRQLRPATGRSDRELRWPAYLSALMLLLAASSFACSTKGKELPAGPETVETGVVIYEGANYEGRSALISESVGDLAAFSGPCFPPEGVGPSNWNDCISSIRIGTGWRATVYTSPNFTGKSLSVTGDQPNLQLVAGDCDHDGMNDCISSIALVHVP